MMMYGVGITPPIDVDAHTPLLSRAIDWCYDQRLTLRHCFCVLPLTTCFFILSLFYVLRLAYYIMPTDVSYTFVHKCLFLIMRFQFSIMHFSNLTYKVCKQFLLWSKACDRSGVCASTSMGGVMPNPYIIITWCKMVFWVFVFYL